MQPSWCFLPSPSYILLFVIVCLRTASTGAAVAQSASFEGTSATATPTVESTTTVQSTTIAKWSVDEVAALAVEYDPLRRALIHERDLARSSPSSKHHPSAPCAVTRWIGRHVDERIKRREAEVQTQAWKLHFGLVQVQAQSLVLSDLGILAESFERLVNGLTREGVASNELLQEVEKLNEQLMEQENQLEYELSRLRIQLHGLLGAEAAKQYWPAENLSVRFQRVDLDEQVALAQTQRSDVSIWSSIPRGTGSITELQVLEGLLSASWIVIPTTVPAPAPLKLLIKKQTEAEVRRNWSKRSQQLEEVAQAKKIEMETEVRLKAVDLNKAYDQAEAKQSYIRKFKERLQQQRMLVEQGIKTGQELLAEELEYQQQRSEWFRMLGNVRQAELDLALATADHERWLQESWRQSSEAGESGGTDGFSLPDEPLKQ